MATYWYYVCCTSSNQNVARATRFIYPVEIDWSNLTGLKKTFKRPKKQKLSLIWLHTGTMVCCTSSNQNVARATTIYLPVEIDRPQKSLKTVPKWNVEPHMATYCYNSLPCKFINPNYAWHNGFTTRSNLTGLKKCFKTAQKTNVEPYMATYWFNSVIYMYFIQIWLGTTFTVNDCQMPLTKDTKYVVLQFLTKCFILGPLSHPQSMVNLDTMITCDWPPSHYWPWYLHWGELLWYLNTVIKHWLDMQIQWK